MSQGMSVFADDRSTPVEQKSTSPAPRAPSLSHFLRDTFDLQPPIPVLGVLFVVSTVSMDKILNVYSITSW